MRIDAAAFSRRYLDGFQSRLAQAQPPHEEAAAVVAEAREKLDELRQAPPALAVAQAADLALRVSLKTAFSGCGGFGSLPLVLAEDAFLSLAAPPAPPAPPAPEGPRAAFAVGRQVAHRENRDDQRREAREAFLEMLRQAPEDPRLTRDRFLFERVSLERAQAEEAAADVRGAEIAEQAGFSREAMAAELVRERAWDPASRVLGHTPIPEAADRRATGDALGALRRREGEDELIQAAPRLRALVDGAADPVVRRVAWMALQPFTDRRSLEGLSLAWGPAAGAAEYLRRVEDAMRGYNTAASTDYEVPQAVARLEPTEEGLRAAAHLVHTVEARAARHEPDKAKMKEWSAAAGQALEGWWRQGALEVTLDGRELTPGEVDLKAEVARQRAGVAGNRIALTSGTLDETFHTAEGLQRLAQALADPAQREALRPQAERLTTTALEHGTLAFQWGQSGAHVAVYDQLLQAFPERLTEDLLRRELGPLLTSGHYDLPDQAAALVQRLWQSRPDLVAPTMEVLLGSHPRQGLVKAKLDLIDRAWHTHGWRPQGSQVDWLVSRAFQPPTLQNTSLFTDRGCHREEFPFFVGLLAELEAERPGALAGQELPGPDGTMTDLRRACLERVLSDSHNYDADKLFPAIAEGQDPVVAALYRLDPPAARVPEMLDRVARGLAHAQFVMDLRTPEKAALGLLAHVSRTDPTVIERLRPVLSGATGASGVELSRFVHGVQSLDAIEKGLAAMTASTEQARGLLDQADRSLDSGLQQRQRSRVLDAWADRFGATGWGADLLARLPDREAALDTVEYLEARQPSDAAGAWGRYRPMLDQAGDPEVARKMFEAARDLQAAAATAGSILAGPERVKIGDISLPVRL